MGTFETTNNPRSLADDLRMRSDEELAILLRSRLDLLNPPPKNISTLAANTSAAISVSEAIANLNEIELVLCEVIAALPDGIELDFILQSLRITPGYDEVVITKVVKRLWQLGLLWGTAQSLHLVRSVREMFGKSPCGLGPELSHSRTSLRKFLEDEALIFELLDKAPSGSVEIIQEMAWGNPRGSYPNAMRSNGTKKPKTPVEWLLANDLLVATDENTVVLPREVAMPIRSHLLLKEVKCIAPSFTNDNQNASQIDASGVFQALEFIQTFELVINLITTLSISPLKSGGFAVKDFDRLHSMLPISKDALTLVLNLAFASQYLVPDELSGCLPSNRYDNWLVQDDATRWINLVSNWKDLALPTRATEKPKTKTSANQASTNSEIELKRTLIDLVSTVEPGQKIDQNGFVEFLMWQRPRKFNSNLHNFAIDFLSDMKLIGITYSDAMTEYGIQSLNEEFDNEHFASLIPAYVDQIIVQADLTALSPGRLPPQQRQFMQRITEVESASVATTYRFTAGSILRGIESGLEPDEILAGITALSMTAIPQPLHYLIQDVARRHGMLTVGSASMYLRCDDPQLLEAIQADRKLSTLKLRSIGTNILISNEPLDFAITQLRLAGYATSLEKVDGVVAISRQNQSPSLLVQPTALPAALPSKRLIQSIVKSLRPTGSEVQVAPTVNRDVVSKTSASIISFLQETLDSSSTIWIGYADRHGLTTEHIIEPLAFESGTMTAFDFTSNQVRTFTIARITSVQPNDGAELTKQEGEAS